MLLLPPKRYPLYSRPLYANDHTHEYENKVSNTTSNANDIYSAGVYPSLLETCTNPIHVFIFLTLFSIWLGGYTKRQIYDFLHKN